MLKDPRCLWLGLIIAALPHPGAASEGPASAVADRDEGWTPLFNGEDLSGWETYLGSPRDGEEPLGLNRDPLQVFSVVASDGEPAIRISGQVPGALTTLEEYGDYWLRLEFRWGDKRWPPEEAAPRNSGILYHGFGAHGAIYGMCLRSHECQIKQGECGDYWSSDTIVEVEGEPASDPEQAPARYRPGGQRFRVHDPRGGPGGRVAHLADHERPPGEWNVVEVLCLGQDAVHVVNGRVVMAIHNSCRQQNGEDVPLTRGRIQLLSEYAEVYFRRVELRPIREFPARYRPESGRR